MKISVISIQPAELSTQSIGFSARNFEDYDCCMHYHVSERE